METGVPSSSRCSYLCRRVWIEPTRWTFDRILQNSLPPGVTVSTFIRREDSPWGSWRVGGGRSCTVSFEDVYDYKLLDKMNSLDLSLLKDFTVQYFGVCERFILLFIRASTSRWLYSWGPLSTTGAPSPVVHRSVHSPKVSPLGETRPEQVLKFYTEGPVPKLSLLRRLPGSLVCPSLSSRPKPLQALRTP